MTTGFFPSRAFAGVTLAPSVYARITVLLRPFRNRLASYKVAVLLAKLYAGKKRLMGTFKIDRRLLSKREDLGLTEAEVRGAIKTLKTIEFITDVPDMKGNIYQRVETANGVENHRLPIQFRFTQHYWVIFAFISGMIGYSPKGRYKFKLENIYRRIAPSLGEKGTNTEGSGGAGGDALRKDTQPTILSWMAHKAQNRASEPQKRPGGQKLAATYNPGLMASLGRYSQLVGSRLGMGDGAPASGRRDD